MSRRHRQTDVIVTDFAAFDKVPHKRLLYKLDFYGIRGSTHKWIDSWLSERSQKVVLDIKELLKLPFKLVLQPPNITRSYCSGTQHLVSCSVLVLNL